jgi:hypothetical protein
MGIPVTATPLTTDPMATGITVTPATDMELVTEVRDTVEARDTTVAEPITRLRGITTTDGFITANSMTSSKGAHREG